MMIVRRSGFLRPPLVDFWLPEWKRIILPTLKLLMTVPFYAQQSSSLFKVLLSIAAATATTAQTQHRDPSTSHMTGRARNPNQERGGPPLPTGDSPCGALGGVRGKSQNFTISLTSLNAMDAQEANREQKSREHQPRGAPIPGTLFCALLGGNF